MNILEIKDLTKKYKDKAVIENLSFVVEEGDIVGLLGRNGAGKSTTINAILNLIGIDKGEIKVLGLDPKKNPSEVLRKIGVATENPSFYSYLNGYNNLKLISNYYENIADEEIKSILQFVGLGNEGDKKVKDYSTGMKQRLGLARALLTNPRIILLDEPTNGLDPYGIKEIYGLIEKLARTKKITFVISSHILLDIERLCDKVVIISNGKCVYQGEMKNIHSLEKLFFEVTGGGNGDNSNKK